MCIAPNVPIRPELALVHAAAAKLKSPERTITTRFGMVLDAMSEAYSITGGATVCERNPAPAWCQAVDLRLAQTLPSALVQSLVDDQQLDLADVDRWQGIARAMCVSELFPVVLVAALGAEKAEQHVTTWARLSAGSIGMPIPGSDLDYFCREHPRHPVCVVAGRNFGARSTQRAARDVLALLELFRAGLLSVDPTIHLLDVAYSAVAQFPGTLDVLPRVAETMARDLVSEDALGSVLARLREVDAAMIPIDGVPEECLGSNPPPDCWRFGRMPRLSTLAQAMLRANAIDEIPLVLRAPGLVADSPRSSGAAPGGLEVGS